MPYTATASVIRCSAITYTFLCTKKTEKRMRTDIMKIRYSALLSWEICRTEDVTECQGMTRIDTAIEV